MGGGSYESFLRCFKVEEAKAYFPYEWMTSYDKLQQNYLVPYEEWFSHLKGYNVLDSEMIAYQKEARLGKSHAQCLLAINLLTKEQMASIERTMAAKGVSEESAMDLLGIHIQPQTGREKWHSINKMWREKGFTNMKQYLHFYNAADTVGFVKAFKSMLTFYKDLGVDVLSQTISAPGISKHFVFKTKPEDSYFQLFNKETRWVFDLFTKNLAGGYSAAICRYAAKDETRIRGNGSLVKKVISYDANSLYLSCFMHEMPTSALIIRRAERQFAPEAARESGVSAIAAEWLDWMAHETGSHIRHYYNTGSEVFVAGHKVDGMAEDGRTIYSFHGCYYHQHSCLAFRPSFDPTVAAAKLHATKDTSDFLRGQGFRVEEIFECEWRRIKRENAEAEAFCKKLFYTRSIKGKMSEENLIHSIVTNQLFGVLEADIHVPDHLLDFYASWPPLYGNSTIRFEDIGAHMQQYVRDKGLSTGPKKLLITANKAVKIMIITPLVKWYLSHGLVITRVHNFFQYQGGQKCFKKFASIITERRRQGDVDESKAILANLAKLTGNASYGIMIQNKMKHTSTKYTKSLYQAQLKINSKHFKSLRPVGDSLIEVNTQKWRNVINTPIQIGFFILQYSKLRMLGFIYDILDKYIDRKDYQILATDTDSVFCSFASENMLALVRPNLREEFKRDYPQWFPKTYCDQCESDFFNTHFGLSKLEWKPCGECKKVAKFESRTPALFKVESKSDVMIALSSKLYSCYTEGNWAEHKARAKGVNISKVDNPHRLYADSLFNKKTNYVQNSSIKIHDNVVKSYSQYRGALTYYYVKRQVHEDGIHTSPLPVTLNPTEYSE